MSFNNIGRSLRRSRFPAAKRVKVASKPNRPGDTFASETQLLRAELATGGLLSQVQNCAIQSRCPSGGPGGELEDLCPTRPPGTGPGSITRIGARGARSS